MYNSTRKFRIKVEKKNYYEVLQSLNLDSKDELIEVDVDLPDSKETYTKLVENNKILDWEIMEEKINDIQSLVQTPFKEEVNLRNELDNLVNWLSTNLALYTTVDLASILELLYKNLFHSKLQQMNQPFRAEIIINIANKVLTDKNNDNEFEISDMTSLILKKDDACKWDKDAISSGNTTQEKLRIVKLIACNLRKLWDLLDESNSDLDIFEILSTQFYK